MSKFSQWWLAAFFTALGVSSSARGTLIDFESLPSIPNINGVPLGGVTLFNPVNGEIGVYQNNQYGIGYHSPITAISDPAFCSNFSMIVAVFDTPQDFVRIWGGLGAGSNNNGFRMQAFDAATGGNSLGLVESGIWEGVPYRSLEISAPGILRIELSRSLGLVCSVAYDDLEFTPEPASALILLLAVATMGRRIHGTSSFRPSRRWPRSS